MSAPLTRAAAEVLADAERIVVNAKWHWCQEQALARLAGCRGLAVTPLFPEHPVIQVVALDGRLLGRATEHHDTESGRTTWVATHAATGREVAACRSLRAAARALLRSDCKRAAASAGR